MPIVGPADAGPTPPTLGMARIRGLAGWLSAVIEEQKEEDEDVGKGYVWLGWLERRVALDEMHGIEVRLRAVKEEADVDL